MIPTTNNNETTTKKFEGTKGSKASSKIGRKRRRRGTIRMDAMKFLLLFIGAMLTLMPFFVFFVDFDSFQSLSNIHACGNSTLASFLANSKVPSLLRPPFLDDGFISHLSMCSPQDTSPYTILHTVTSRFMVGQAPKETYDSKQLEIQRARYLLFEAFCWPTMKYQTSMNFFWLVLVDPGLDPRIIEDMRDLMSNEKHFPVGNAYLVLTNNTEWASDGIGIENSTSYAVGLRPVAQEFRGGNLDILTGNTDYLLRALDMMDGKDKASIPKRPLMVIETLLDTDDGLNNRAVEWIQTAAIKRTQQHSKQKLFVTTTNNTKSALKESTSSIPPSLNSTWWFLCGTDHIEWHNREIFKLTEKIYNESGITSGLAGLRKSPLFCTSAGFSRIGITDIPADTSKSNYSHMVFPKDGYSNHALTFYFPECSTNAVANGNYSACWHREFRNESFVLKSRTITSDSMDHLNVAKTKDYRDIAWLNASDYPLLINDTEQYWDILKEEFSISRTKAWETSRYIYEHRSSIIHQNKESRCTPGFPCYKTAKRNLIRMERYWHKLQKAQK